MIPKYKKSRDSEISAKLTDMARKLYTDKPAVLTLKMEPEFLRDIDSEVLRRSNQAGHIVTRTEVVKDLLREALTARLKKRSK